MRNFGESVVKLSPTLSILDWFTPYDYNYLNSIDFDLSSSSSIGLPGTTLLAAGAKNGKVYLLDTNNMGKWRSGNDNQTVQWFQASGGHIHSSMLYYVSPTRGRLLYVWGENDVVKAWSFNGSVFQTTPVDQSTISVVPGYANGPGMSISANGSVVGTGILWSTLPLGDAVHQQVPGIIRAFDASNLSTELWNSQQNLARDDFGKWAKWCPPTVVNGRVYVSTLSNQLCVYGLLTPAAPSGLTATPSDKQVVLNWQTVPGVSSYNVKRSATNGGPYATIKTGSAATSCTDIGLVNGTTYYYVVSAVNSNLEGANSGQVSAVPSAGASSATFIKLDSTTQGTWKTVYGNDGYALQGDATLLPSYAQVAYAGGNSYTWNASTTDVRALQKAAGTDRIAACLYSSSSFTIDVNLTDGLTHQVSLYALDWDYNSRNATFEALDSTTNAVLDTQSLTPFDSGKYLVWSVKGHVKFRVTNVGSSNCVFSGLFFDTAGPPTVPVAPTGLTAAPGNAQVVLNWQAVAGATSYNVKRGTAHNGPYSVVKTGQTTASYTDTGLTNGTTYYYVVSAVNGVGEGANSSEASALPVANANSATFVKLDSTTQGNWKTVYGLDGYSIQGLATLLPAYAQLTLTGANAYTWNASTTDARALQKTTGTDRIAACWYADQNFLADINLTDGQTHPVAIYALDWDYNNRNIKLEALDAVTNAVLDTQNLTPFDSGKYLVWNLRGHVKIRVTNINASNAVISGVFFK